MFEHHTQPLLPRRAFVARMLVHWGAGLGILLGSLLLGVVGYHGFERLSWIDALVNSAMLLGGMGPVDTLHTDGGKIFASLYALYSGVVFLVVVGVSFAPVIHRFLHRLHLEAEDASTP
jgi:hypothetical protein